MKYNGVDVSKFMYNGAVVPKFMYNGVQVSSGGGSEAPPEDPTLTVISVNPIADITLNNGTPLANIGLPATVACTMSNWTTGYKSVTWDTGSPTYSPTTAGSYMFTGDVADTDETAYVTVIVSEAPETPTDLVVNGTFSNGSTGWTAYGNWTFTNGQAVLNATAKYEQCLQKIAVYAGVSYKVNGYCSVSNGDGAIHAYYLNASGGIISQVYNIHLQPDTIVTAPAGCTQIQISLINNTTNTKPIYFDNISMVRV
jgi:hypothetical protein